GGGRVAAARGRAGRGAVDRRRRLQPVPLSRAVRPDLRTGHAAEPSGTAGEIRFLADARHATRRRGVRDPGSRDGHARKHRFGGARVRRGSRSRHVEVTELLNLASGSQAHPDYTNVDFFPARVRYRLPDVGAVARAVSEGRGTYTTASGATVRIVDLRKGVPFPDASFDVVYHSNFLEHLERPDARRFLAECRRVLRPGGITRVVVPDLEEKARAYLAALAGGDAAAQEFAVADLIDQMVRTRTGGELAALLEPDRVDTAPKPLRQRLGERAIGTQRAADTGELHRWM